jgi:hypothetical protein
MNTRTINKVLKDSHIWTSYTANSSRVRGWSNTSEGAEISADVICTYADRKLRGKWRTFVKQTGVYGIVWNASTYMGATQKKNPTVMLKKIARILSDKFGANNVTLDLKGKYTIYGKDSWTSGAKVIVGDVSKLSLKHY